MQSKREGSGEMDNISETHSKRLQKLQGAENFRTYKQIRDFLSTDVSCPICFEPYIEARITKCLHVFCRTCIIQSTLSTRSATCAICRQKTKLSGLSGIKGLDALIEGLLIVVTPSAYLERRDILERRNKAIGGLIFKSKEERRNQGRRVPWIIRFFARRQNTISS